MKTQIKFSSIRVIAVFILLVYVIDHKHKGDWHGKVELGR